MELSKCLGCMEDFLGYPCPYCGYDPSRAQGQEYTLPPQTILAGKYLVGRVLGQGGFGITYIGWDIALERKVAIKEYYPKGQVSRNPGSRRLTWYHDEQAQLARKDGMEMFLKEARKMSRVDDIPGVVRVRELFQENDTAYIVMDFVEGETLKARLKRSGPMSWDQAKEIFRPAIRAMEQVHKAGLIHRDLSPDNLMLTPEGQVFILDLGAAKDLNVNQGASSMQVAKGGFSPFEQYTQRGGSGPWTDVYAMAATIYFTLTGKLPPVATDRVDEDTISWDLPRLDTLPRQALEALKKAMVVSAKKRTQSMEELEKGLFEEWVEPEPEPERPRKTIWAAAAAVAQELEDELVEEETEPEPISEPEPNPKPAPKMPWKLVWAAAASVALLGGVVYGTVVKPGRDYKKAQTPMATEATERYEAAKFETSEPVSESESTEYWDPPFFHEEPSDLYETSPDPEEPLPPEAAPRLVLQVGQTYTMGSYEQDGVSSNGPEPIDWIVLDVRGDRALLISKYCLDAAQFHSTQTAVTWETCDLRKWLNGSFLDTAFTGEEASMILSTSLSTPKSAYGEKSGGKDTVDKLFCLSSDEASHYFSSDNDRRAALTPYASNRTSYSWWWLRSPGGETDAAKAIVNADGRVTTGGNWVDNNDSVRPAMWISTQ